MTAPDVIPLNCDDDNGNDLADSLDGGPVAGENDLRPLHIQLSSGCPGLGAPLDQVVWRISEGSGNRTWRAYRNPDKTGPVDSSTGVYQPWPPPATLWLEGLVPTQDCPSRVVLWVGESYGNGGACIYCGYEGNRPSVAPCPGGAALQEEGLSVTAAGTCVALALDWDRADTSNLELDRCPNNGGRRIFPDKLSPEDTNPALRRRVHLVVRTIPAAAGQTVHIRIFDVDDPFDQLNASMPDVTLIDGNVAGPDNRPAGESMESFTRTTDQEGKAVVEWTAGMQPGNNYRAAASVSSSAITQATQAVADSLGAVFESPTGLWRPNGDFAGYQPCETAWSPMLTVWRKLHVETDSMVRPTFGQNTVTGTWDNPSAPMTEPYVGLPSPPWFEIKVSDPMGGSATAQFNGGLIELDGTILSRVYDYFSSAGYDEVIIQAPGGLGGLASGNFAMSDDDLTETDVFSAKVFGCDNGYANDAALAPPDLTALPERYAPAYIFPVHEIHVSGVGGMSVFQVNMSFGLPNYGIAFWNQAFSARQLPVATSDYWAVLVVSGWQAETSQDGDPDTETLTNGISTHGVEGTSSAIWTLPHYLTGICAIFKALMIAESDIPERYTVAHEIGHTLGLPHSDSGLMFAADQVGAPNEQAKPFSSDSLRRLRHYDGP